MAINLILTNGVLDASQESTTTTPSPVTSVDVVMVDWSVVPRVEVVLELGLSPFSPPPDPPTPQPAQVVEPGQKLKLRLTPGISSATNVVWYRDDSVLASNVPEMVYSSVSSSQSGIYHATFSYTEGGPVVTTLPMPVIVRAASRHRIANQSSRLSISPNNPSAIFGFVIEPTTRPETQNQEMLIRIVGPTLNEYGVPQPLQDPAFELRRSSTGEVITLQHSDYVLPDGTTERTRYYRRIRDISAAVGAFPIILPDSTEHLHTDQVMLVELESGAYTVSARSSANLSGEVLIEIYEIPAGY